MLKKKAVFQNPSLWELKWNQVQLSACRSDWTAVGLSPVTSSALSFRNSSKVMKRCLRQWSTRSWIWYSCFYPSTVWKSWTSTPRTVKVSYPWISPSWPTMCPWPSCFSKLGPRRAPTVSKKPNHSFCVFSAHFQCIDFLFSWVRHSKLLEKVVLRVFLLAKMHKTQKDSHQTKDCPAIILSLLQIQQKTVYTTVVWSSIQLKCNLVCGISKCAAVYFSIYMLFFNWTEVNIFNFPLDFYLTWTNYGCDAELSNFRLTNKSFGNHFHLLHFVPVSDVRLYRVMSEPVQCLLSPGQHPIQLRQNPEYDLLSCKGNNPRTPGYQRTPTCWQWNQNKGDERVVQIMKY